MTLAVFLVAAASLAFELSLLRILSVLYWHHQVQLVLSGALLGFGAGGTALTLRAEAWVARRQALATLLPAVALVATAASYRIALAVPFNALQLAWDPGELLNLAAIHLTLAIPFLVTSLFLGLALVLCPERQHALYAANLAGSGAGALVGVGAAEILAPGWLILPVAVLGLAAAWLAACAGGGSRRARVAAWMLPLAAVPLIGPRFTPELRPSPYKGEVQSLLVPGTRLVAERSGSLGHWRALRGPSVHYAPGLSLQWRQPLPEQAALFVDGEGGGAVTACAGPTDSLPALVPGFLDHLPTAMAQGIRPARRVFIARLGGGLSVLESLRAGAESVTVAEPDHAAVAILARDLAEFSGYLLSRPQVRVVRSDPRLALSRAAPDLDLVRFDYLQGLVTAGGGAFASRPSYALTEQSFHLALARLSPRGILAVADGITLPPRESLRSLATVTAALAHTLAVAEGPGGRRRAGDGIDLRPYVFMIRSWNTTLILASLSPFQPHELEYARSFCETRGFDRLIAPGMGPEEEDRFHQEQDPVFRRAALALLGPGREDFLRSYPFDVSPATDDRPYVSHTFRWRSFPGLLHTMGRDLIPYVEGGYLLLVASLLEGLVVAAILLMLPRVVDRRGRPVRGGTTAPRGAPARVTIYFGLIGAAFMTLELALLAQLDLLIGNPLISAGITIGALLSLAAIGSHFSLRLASDRRPLRAAAALVLAASILVPVLVDRIAGSPLADAGVMRYGVAVLLLGAVALPLGTFFPAGLRLISRDHPHGVPWAWAVNGFASVIGSLLGALLPLSLGLRGSMLLAGAAYVAASMVLPRASAGDSRAELSSGARS